MLPHALPIVIGLGELLWDCFPDSRRPGGAPANVAFHTCQLGCRGIVCSRVGCDALGDQLLAFLQTQGLSTDWVQRDARHPTGTVTVDLSEPGHPRFTIHENVAWDFLEFDAALEELAGQAAAVCFGTLAQRCETSRRTIQRVLAAVPPKCLVVYDVNLRQHWFQRDWIEQSLRASRIVKLNADEVVELDKLLGVSDASGRREGEAPAEPSDTAREITAAAARQEPRPPGRPPGPDHEHFARAIQRQYGVETVSITRGERGCLLVGRDQVVDRPGVAVKLADSVGAGDAFTAALILGQLRAWPLESQASFANAVGALVAGQPGAMPEVREEFAWLTAAY